MSSNDDELSEHGEKALRTVQGGALVGVPDHPGWYWPCLPCGPQEIRELERLKLVVTEVFPYSGGRSAGETVPRLALQITKYGQNYS